MISVFSSAFHNRTHRNSPLRDHFRYTPADFEVKDVPMHQRAAFENRKSIRKGYNDYSSECRWRFTTSERELVSSTYAALVEYLGSKTSSVPNLLRNGTRLKQHHERSRNEQMRRKN